MQYNEKEERKRWNKITLLTISSLLNSFPIQYHFVSYFCLCYRIAFTQFPFYSLFSISFLSYFRHFYKDVIFIGNWILSFIHLSKKKILAKIDDFQYADLHDWKKKRAKTKILWRKFRITVPNEKRTLKRKRSKANCLQLFLLFTWNLLHS